MATKTDKKAGAKSRPVASKTHRRVAPPASNRASTAAETARKATPKAVAAKTAKTATTKAQPAPEKTAAATQKIRPKGPLDAKSLAQIKDILLKMRERLTGQITTLSDDSLKYKDDGSSEDRTDDFDREFALNLVSSEHDAIFEIDGAIRRIEEGIYGLCDACGCPVEKARLQALPFARMCVKCQSEAEKGRVRFRPLGETLAQGVEQTPEVVEAEEAE